MLLRTAISTGFLLLLLMPRIPAAADVLGEGVIAIRCTEHRDLAIPKRMELVQAILTDDYADYDRVALFLDAEYGDGDSIDQGQVRATAFLVKDDGSESKLGRLKARMRGGEASTEKLVTAKIEAGDLVRWKVKTKKLPKMLAADENCIEFGLAVVVAEDLGELE